MLRRWSAVRREARNEALIPAHRTDPIRPSHSASFDFEERRGRQVARPPELHRETSRAERLASVLREEPENGVGQCHASRKTFVTVRQASQGESCHATLTFSAIVSRATRTRRVGRPVFFAMHSTQSEASVMAAETSAVSSGLLCEPLGMRPSCREQGLEIPNHRGLDVGGVNQKGRGGGWPQSNHAGRASLCVHIRRGPYCIKAGWSLRAGP